MLKCSVARLLVVFAVLLSACQMTGPAPAPSACRLSAEDQAWLDSALQAWRFTSREITGVHPDGDFGAVIFDANCTLSSRNALSATDDASIVWTAAPHTGAVIVRPGLAIPAGVTSFATSHLGEKLFIMSTPSVWRANAVSGEPITLEDMMTFVLLHEGSHVAQLATYGERIGAAAERYNLSEDISDDTMQEDFGDDPRFAASVLRETELFVEAADSDDDAAALRLAREARAMMKERAEQYFTGQYAHYHELEDVWLTFEGAGQWAGYRWLIHPQGKAMDPAVARRAAMRSRWWSQNQGLAIALVLDRIGPSDWHATAFGDGSQTLLEMLDATLAHDAAGQQ